MQLDPSQPDFHFSSSLPIVIYCRPTTETMQEWQEFDRGPGYFDLPQGQDVMIKIKQISDDELCELTQELKGCNTVTSLDLAENRKVTDDGLECLKNLSQLVYLNLSSCDITNTGLPYLLELQQLKVLNLSYCHRLTDIGLRTLKGLPHLIYLDLQGVLHITKAGMSKIRKDGLTIHR